MSNGTPRRLSIFSGVLWILVGSLLLLIQLRPDLGGWSLFRTYWPVILIVWGLAKLFDAMAARRAGEPTPRTFGAGEVFLLILVLMIGGTVSGVSWLRDQGGDIDILLGPWEHEYSFSEEVKSTQPVKEDARIQITADRGNITVHPEETPEIRVVVNKTAIGNDENKAKERASQVAVVVEETGGGYEIRTKRDARGRTRVRVNLEVHVPRRATVRAKTERGDIQIAGLVGAATASAHRGDIHIRDVGGDVEVEARHGDIHVLGARSGVKVSGRGGEVEVAEVGGEVGIQGEFRGPIRLKNVAKEARYLSRRTDLTITQLPGRMEMGGGNLEIYDTPGSVLVTTKDKDIVLENVGGRIQVQNRHGNVEVRLAQAPKEEVDISNESGSVELALPGNASFELTATARNGDVESEFEGPELKKTETDGDSSLQGKLGAKGPRITLKTSYGTVRLRKKS